MGSSLLLTHQRRKPHLISSVPYVRCHVILHAQPRCASLSACLCITEHSIGQRLSAQPLSAQRLCEAVSQAYFYSGVDPPENIKAHGTRGISTSMALHGGMTVENICNAASWSSHCSFIRFYLRDVSHSSLTHSVLNSCQIEEYRGFSKLQASLLPVGM